MTLRYIAQSGCHFGKLNAQTAPGTGLSKASMPGYQVRQEGVTVMGDANFIIRSLLDRQQFLDPLGEGAAQGISSAACPIFGILQPSGRVLATAMMTHPFLGKRILEIGCGIGLATLVVHRRPMDITATDRHPLAGEFLRANVSPNHLPFIKYQSGNWTDTQSGLHLFDLIVGSDVLYERDEAVSTDSS